MLFLKSQRLFQMDTLFSLSPTTNDDTSTMVNHSPLPHSLTHILLRHSPTHSITHSSTHPLIHASTHPFHSSLLALGEGQQLYDMTLFQMVGVPMQPGETVRHRHSLMSRPCPLLTHNLTHNLTHSHSQSPRLAREVHT